MRSEKKRDFPVRVSLSATSQGARQISFPSLSKSVTELGAVCSIAPGVSSVSSRAEPTAARNVPFSSWSSNASPPVLISYSQASAERLLFIAEFQRGTLIIGQQLRATRSPFIEECQTGLVLRDP